MINIFLNKTEVKEYLEASKSFCEYIESPSEVGSVEFLKTVRLLLLTLYEKGLAFPLYHGDSTEDTEDLLGENYSTVLNLIQQKVGKMDFYNHVFEPTNLEDKNPVVGMLSDDLGDIYRDIKRALLQLETTSETAREDALWNLHFFFRHHYGEHIMNGMYAIHFYLQHE